MLGCDLTGPLASLLPHERRSTTLGPPPSLTRAYVFMCLSDATSSVLYLRTLLRALDWAAANQYDVRALLEKILTTAKNVGALYSVFFDR